MTKQNILSGILLILLLYPVISFFRIEQVIDNGAGPEIIEQRISQFQLSIWLTWLVMIAAAVSFKWITENNFFFYLIYIFLLVAFGILGYFIQEMINIFEIQTGFGDDYSYGMFTALINFLVAAVLTGFLQVSVWWFTRRWHRNS